MSRFANIALILCLVCAPAALFGSEGTEFRVKGTTALKEAQSDPKKLTEAIQNFLKAIPLYETAKKQERIEELNSYLYWCRKKMNAADVDAFVKGLDAASAARLAAILKNPDAAEAQKWTDRAEAFATANKDEHLLISIRFFEVADRFKGTELSLKAQDRSLREMQLSARQPAPAAAAPKPKEPAKTGDYMAPVALDVAHSLPMELPIALNGGCVFGPIRRGARVYSEILNVRLHNGQGFTPLPLNELGEKKLKITVGNINLTRRTYRPLFNMQPGAAGKPVEHVFDSDAAGLFIDMSDLGRAQLSQRGWIICRMWLPFGATPIADYGVPSPDGYRLNLDESKSQVLSVPPSDSGCFMGTLKAGTTLYVQYVSGKWKTPADAVEVSPDDPETLLGSRLSLVGIEKFEGENPMFLDLFPSGTRKRPYGAYIQADIKTPALRIADNALRNNAPGDVQYRVWIVPPGEPQPIRSSTALPPVAANPAAPAKAPVGKTPIPEDGKIREAEKLIKELYAADYAKNGPGDSAALGKKLLQQCEATTDDLAARFLLGREARDLAVARTDPEAAFTAIDTLARFFALNPATEKIATLKKMGELAKTKIAGTTVVDFCARSIRDQIGTEDYDNLKSFLTVAEQCAARVVDAELSRRTKEVVALVNEVSFERARAKTSEEILKTAPSNADANASVGKFHCLLRNDWKRGLPYLAKGSNKELKAVAEKDIAAPADAAGQLAVGDAWWDLTEKLSPGAQYHARLRALSWYKTAVEGLEGVARTRTESRIRQIEPVPVVTLRDGLPTSVSLDLPGGAKMEFVLISTGKFAMGSERYVGQGPVHVVTLTRPYYIAKYEVTEEQYQALLPLSLVPQGQRYPVGGVAFADAQEYCRKLSQHTGKKLRLPSEAEWEFACWGGATELDAEKLAWHAGIAGKAAHEIGKRAANGYGLHDMLGNVCEWCVDWYDVNYYAKSAPLDPVNTTVATQRVSRGGSFVSPAENCTATIRSGTEPNERYSNFGFRILMEANER